MAKTHNSPTSSGALAIFWCFVGYAKTRRGGRNDSQSREDDVFARVTPFGLVGMITRINGSDHVLADVPGRKECR